jgi:hypothetical protein
MPSPSSLLHSAVSHLKGNSNKMGFTPPKTYKAMSVQEKGSLELIDVPWKDPEDGQIIAKVLACGVCHRYVQTRSGLGLTFLGILILTSSPH